MGELEKGDLVLATKWHDGDPCDHFVVGFWKSLGRNGKHNVVDDKGHLFRVNGFQRAEKISEYEAELLLEIMADIADKPGRPIWFYLETLRKLSFARENLPELDPAKIYENRRCHTI